MSELRRLVVIVGAARSGTKMLRDCLRDMGAGVVPYDVNFLWRTGNESFPSDELPANLAQPEIAQRVQRRLAPYAVEATVVEKTVSNTLRVPFVWTLFPETRFVHLVRDGVDVVESAYRQWSARPDWRYTWAKLANFPPTVAPRYVLRYGREALRRQIGRGTVPVWGPRYAGIETDVQEHGILFACARQWQKCVTLAQTGLEIVPPEQQLELVYEEFVADPVVQLERVATFCGVGRPGSGIAAASKVRAGERGKGRASLSEADLETVLSVIGETRTDLGYVD